MPAGSYPTTHPAALANYFLEQLTEMRLVVTLTLYYLIQIDSLHLIHIDVAAELIILLKYLFHFSILRSLPAEQYIDGISVQINHIDLEQVA